MSDKDDPRIELVLGEAVRAIEAQRSSLDEVRGRAGTMFGAASIAAGFLGAEAFKDGRRFTLLTLLATGAFVFVGAITAAVLAPRSPKDEKGGVRGWAFALGPRAMIDAYINTPPPLSPRDMQREMALRLEDAYDRNAQTLDRLLFGLQVRDRVRYDIGTTSVGHSHALAVTNGQTLRQCDLRLSSFWLVVGVCPE